MARLNIEESAFSKARRIAPKVGMTYLNLLGRLANLWHESQNAEVIEADIEDLCLWLELEKAAVQDLIPVLISNEILVQTNPSEFEIVGNSKHIGNLKKCRRAAKAGGEKSGSVRLKRPLELNTVQYNTKQSIAVQYKPPKPPEGAVGQAAKIWLGTLESFGVDRKHLGNGEDIALLRAIQAHGPDEVALALEGARYEPKTETYDPADRPRLERILGLKMFTTFADLGRKARVGKIKKPAEKSPDVKALRVVAGKIWQAAGKVSLRPAVKDDEVAWRALKETYGSWENLGMQNENQSSFIINRLQAKLKEIQSG